MDLFGATADSLNLAIDEAEKKLRECWKAPGRVRLLDDAELCWGKLNGSYRLFVARHLDGGPDGLIDMTALTKCSLEERVEALKLLPVLWEELRRAEEAMILNMQEAIEATSRFLAEAKR